jgi:hypothetical protein
VITHVVMFRWKPEITDADRAAISAALDTLPAAVPSIRTYVHGPDVGASTAANYDYAIAATFDDVDGWREYDVHPTHDDVRANVIRPWVAERAAVQFGS